MVVENSNSPKLNNDKVSVITHKVSIEKKPDCQISKSIQFFVNFIIGMIGKELEHLLECLKLYGK